MSMAALRRRRIIQSAVPEDGGGDPVDSEFTIEVLALESGSNVDALLSLMFPDDTLAPDDDVAFRQDGSDLRHAWNTTSTHLSGNIRTATALVRLPETTAGVIQAIVMVKGATSMAAPLEYATPSYDTSSYTTGVTRMKVTTPWPAIGGFTDADHLCRANVVGDVAPLTVTSEDEAPGQATYESELARCMGDIVDEQYVVDVASGGSFNNSYQYDRPLLCLNYYARTGDVRHLARALQSHVGHTIIAEAVGPPGPYSFSEVVQQWETYGLLAPWLFDDRAGLDYLISLTGLSYSGYWSYDVFGLSSYAGGRWMADKLRRCLILIRAGYGENETSDGFTMREVAKKLVLDIMDNERWTATDDGYTYTSPGAYGTDNSTFFNAFLTMAMQEVLDELTTFTEEERAAIIARLCGLWDQTWLHYRQFNAVGGVMGFTYDVGIDEDITYPDLNGLYLAQFGWLYRATGDAKWKTRGDAFLATWPDNVSARGFLNVVGGTPGSGGGNPGAQSRGKVFQESYTWSQRYLARRILWSPA